MKKFALLAVAAVAVLASCSKEGSESTGGAKTIEFRSVVEKGRASVIGTTADLQSFFVLGDNGDDDLSFLSAAVYRDGASWSYAPKKVWPADNSDVKFFAYSPINDAVTSSMSMAAGVASFNYTVPADQSVLNTACDLLVASGTGNGTVNAATPVSFTFYHALSAVTFTAINKNEAATGLVYTISKIELTNLGVTSTYNFSTWAAPAAQATTYVAGVPASGVAVSPAGAAATGVKLLSANDVMMVLPQTALATSKVKITYGLMNGDQVVIPAGTTKEFALPATFAFAEGQRYNFKFTFDASNMIEFTVASVTAWTDTDQAI